MERFVYLDNAATTKTAPEVVDAMLPYFTENYGNPSSVYSFASKNKEVIAKQREIIADVLGAASNEIYFTAGGSEADKRRQRLIKIKVTILLRRKLNTMQFCIRQNIWKNMGLK